MPRETVWVAQQVKGPADEVMSWTDKLLGADGALNVDQRNRNGQQPRGAYVD